MRSTFQCIVILLICSGSVFCELELYPDDSPDERKIYEDAVKTLMYQPDFAVLPPPISRLNNPARPTHPFNLNFNPRIREIAKRLKDIYRKPNYEHLNAAEKIKSVYENIGRNNFMPMFKQNMRILDDVRQQSGESMESSGFDFKDNFADEMAEEYENSGKEEQEAVRERETSWKNIDDPSEFAYAPSDPRYHQDNKASASEESRLRVEPKNEKFREDVGSVSLSPRVELMQYADQETTRPVSDYQRTLQANEVKMVPVNSQHADTTGMYLIAIVAGISAAATVGLIAFTIGWYNLQKHVKNASDVDYPAYGITGPNKEVSPSAGDRRLAQSAQMYHYQHQKQQIIAMERAAATDRHGSISEADSDEENEEGDYTVYECPGLAPTGEMEVKNPLFQDDPTPAQTPALKKDEAEKE